MAVKESLILEIQAELGTVKSKIEGLVNEFKELRTQLAKAEVQAEKTANELKGIKGAISGLESAVKRIPSAFDQWTQRITFFYFNLLAIKDLIDQIAEPLKVGFDFNATLENTKLAFAALLTSLGEIKESGQEITDQAEKFNKALLLAEDLQKRLRIEAVKSVATYKELVEITQGILAPYLSAGGKLEELPQFAVLMANLVRTFQLPIEQAVQEARDILSGTITSDTQTARALGITNEDIQRWKEQGVLIEKLKERLSGIVIASERLQDSWSGILSNLQDAFELFASVASKPLFEEVKKDLKQILDYVLVIDKTTGQVQLNPELLKQAKELGNNLKEVYSDLKEFAQGVYEFGKAYGDILVKLAEAYLAVKLGTKAFSVLKGTLTDLKAIGAELSVLKSKAENFADSFYSALAKNPKALALFRAGFLAEWALISYEAGKLFWKALDKVTGGFVTYLGQKFFWWIDRIGVEVRHLLGKLHLPGGLTEKEYEAELRRLKEISEDIEREYQKGVSAFEEQHQTAQKVLETRKEQKEVEKEIKQTKNELLNLEYQINQIQQIDKDHLKEIEKAVKETAKGYEQWLKQLERLKDLANSVLERVKQSYERVKNFLFPQKVSIPEQIRNLFAQFRNVKAKLSVETDSAKIKELSQHLDQIRAKAESLFTTDGFRKLWEQFKEWTDTHGGVGYAQILEEKFGLPKDLAQKVLAQNFTTPKELFSATFGQLFNVSDLAPKLQQNLDKQINNIQTALMQTQTLLNQLSKLEQGVNIPIRLVDIESQVKKLISAIPKEVAVKVRLQPITPDGQYRQGI
jgi:DNA repair exonuclease SbcCD ATPase subunit